MLTSISRNSSWTSVALIALVATFLITVQDARSAQPKHLSKKQVVELITTAKSPEDHLQLARYYKAEADRLEAEAKDHDELAAAYRKSTTSQASAMKSDDAKHGCPLRVLCQIGSRSGSRRARTGNVPRANG